MKNPLTSSERRGILAVAAIALLVTGGGLAVSRCGKGNVGVSPLEVEVLVSESDSGERNIGKKKGKRRERKDSVSRKGKERKTYRRRSPLDESAE